MRRSLLLGLLFILGSATAINGQAILVPRRHSPDKQSRAGQTDTAAGVADASGAAASAGGAASAGAADAGDQSREQLKSKTASLPAALPVSAINISLRISGQVATVTVAHLFANDTDDLLEGT